MSFTRMVTSRVKRFFAWLIAGTIIALLLAGAVYVGVHIL